LSKILPPTEHSAQGANDDVRLVRFTDRGDDLEELSQAEQGKAAGVDWNYDRVGHSQTVQGSCSHGRRRVDHDDIELPQHGPEFLSQQQFPVDLDRFK
jgi:hypothetical protein